MSQRHRPSKISTDGQASKALYFQIFAHMLETVANNAQTVSTWPGVKLAYDFVLPSYQLAITRFEAADSRIQTLQAFIVTVTLGLPTIATLIFKNIPFTSRWFIMACGLAVTAVVIGVIGRSWGGITLVHPQILYEKWLHKQEWEFRKDMLYFAAEHFEQNAALVNRKGLLVTIMTILFLLEAGLLFAWIISARG